MKLTIIKEPDDDEPLPVHRNARPTERDAAASARQLARETRRNVLKVLHEHGPMTGKEVHQVLGGNLYTVLPRISEMNGSNPLSKFPVWVEPTGVKRNRCYVWRLTSAGRDVVERLREDEA